MLEIVVLFFRFSVKVTVSWVQGSNVDVAIDNFAIGAACFDTGTLWPTSNDLSLRTKYETSKHPRGSGSELMTPIVVKSLAIKLSAHRETPMFFFVFF